MTFWSSIMEKIGTIPDEMIHITLEFIVHLHGHQNKVVPLVKPFVLVNINNGTKFGNYIC